MITNEVPTWEDLIEVLEREQRALDRSAVLERGGQKKRKRTAPAKPCLKQQTNRITTATKPSQKKTKQRSRRYGSGSLWETPTRKWKARIIVLGITYNRTFQTEKNGLKWLDVMRHDGPRHTPRKNYADGRIGIYTPKQRVRLLEKFRAKRRNRVWFKKVRYGCRKNFADRRLRIKGRFVREDSQEYKDYFANLGVTSQAVA